MKTFLALVVLAAMALLLFMLLGYCLVEQLWWQLAVLLLSVCGLLFVLIRHLVRQVDYNPYYADMVRNKRDWVRAQRLQSTK